MNNDLYTNENRFCRKCGCRLLPDSIFCGSCGTKVEYVHNEFCNNVNPNNHLSEQERGESETTSKIDIYKTSQSDAGARIGGKPSDYQDNNLMANAYIKKRKYAFFSTICILILSVVLFIAFYLRISHNIDRIYGCPEFYGVEFDMTTDEVSELIEVKHTTISGMRTGHNDKIYLAENSKYRLYGIPVTDVECEFDGKALEKVKFVFSNNDVSINKIFRLYRIIYGKPTLTNDEFWIWKGKNTTIEIYDSEFSEDNNDKIVIVYTITSSSEYTVLSFGGEEIDPCGFLNRNYIFNKEPSYFITGLEKGEDYDVKYIEEARFYQYTLYPQFEYMGVEEGYTGIEFTVADGENKINGFSYVFLLDESNVVESVSYIKNALTNLYGYYENCCYTSMIYGELGIIDIDFEEFKRRLDKNIQGIYKLQWLSQDKNIILTVSIDPGRNYLKGWSRFII